MAKSGNCWRAVYGHEEIPDGINRSIARGRWGRITFWDILSRSPPSECFILIPFGHPQASKSLNHNPKLQLAKKLRYHQPKESFDWAAFKVNTYYLSSTLLPHLSTWPPRTTTALPMVDYIWRLRTLGCMTALPANPQQVHH